MKFIRNLFIKIRKLFGKADISDLIVQLTDIRTDKAILEAKESAIKNQITLELEKLPDRTTHISYFGKELIATLSDVTMEQLNKQKFKTEHPKLFEKYLNITNYTRLLIKDSK